MPRSKTASAIQTNIRRIIPVQTSLKKLNFLKNPMIIPVSINIYYILLHSLWFNEIMKLSTSSVISILLVFTMCSSGSTEETKVLSLEDMESTTTTVLEEELVWSDVELILAQCMRDNGYDIADPTSQGELRKLVTPLFVNKTPEQQREIYGVIEQCADENDIPLDARSTVDPEQQAAILDAELEIAQCLRGKNLDVGDPSSETALRTLLQPLVFNGVITAQNLRELVRECLVENDYEVPENLREEND